MIQMPIALQFFFLAFAGWVIRLQQDVVERSHRERHHQGLESRLIEPDDTAGRTEGEVARRERLGGLLNYYYREAA